MYQPGRLNVSLQSSRNCSKYTFLLGGPTKKTSGRIRKFGKAIEEIKSQSVLGTVEMDELYT